jgi:glycosyltransferase involved in cell wall biosynthesis
MITAGGLAPAGRVQVVPNPIDPEDVCAVATTPPGSSLRIAYVGTPAGYKGFDLLPALVRATRHDPVSWTVFSGPETMMADVFTELRALGVDVRGKVVDVRAAYAACDVVIVPSRRESFGRVVVEAMANGLPVIASDLEPVRNLLGDNEAGLLVPVGDVSAMAAAVRRLAGDPAWRRSLGAEGRRRSAQYAPGPVTGALQRLYGAAPPL